VEYLKSQKIIENEKRKADYAQYMKYGDLFLKRKIYTDAVYEYQQALHTRFNDAEAHKKILLAYSLQCFNEDRSCEYTVYKLKELIDRYPQDQELYRMLFDCMEYTGDTTGRYAYYLKMINLAE